MCIIITVSIYRYYSTSIFCKVGVRKYISTALVGTLNFLTTFLAIVLVDKVRGPERGREREIRELLTCRHAW